MSVPGNGNNKETPASYSKSRTPRNPPPPPPASQPTVQIPAINTRMPAPSSPQQQYAAPRNGTPHPNQANAGNPFYQQTGGGYQTHPQNAYSQNTPPPQFPPQQLETNNSGENVDSTRSKTPLYISLAVLVVALLLVIAFVFYKVINTGQKTADSGSKPSTSASASAQPSATNNNQEAAQNQQRQKLRSEIAQMSANPTCTDTVVVSEKFRSLADVSPTPEEWSTVSSTVDGALTALSSRCGPEYTGQLRAALTAPGMPANLVGNASQTNWMHLTSPAPAGAEDRSEFTTPTRNIRCQIHDGRASCSIYAYDYPSPPGCEEQTATYEVGTTGPVSSHCQTKIQASGEAGYGTTIRHDGFACTVQKYEGVTCWSELSGSGFQIKRAADRTF